MWLCLLRLAEFTREQDRVKKTKPHGQIQTSLADRFSQLQDAENAWKKKVTFHCQWLLKINVENPAELVLECIGGSFLDGQRSVMGKSCHMSGLPWLCVQGVEGWSADTFSSSAESAYFSEPLPNGCLPDLTVVMPNLEIQSLASLQETE